MRRPHLITFSLALVVIAAILTGDATPPAANPTHTATRERLAILYSPQFNFTREGEPLIHAGVASGMPSTTFEADAPLRVLALERDQAELVLPAGERYQVTMGEGRRGSYRHWVIVDRVPWGQRKATDAAIEAWVERGYLPQTFEVGGLFAIGARRFDSRVTLIAVGGYEQRAEAAELAERLGARFGVEAELHSEILSFPGGELSLQGKGAKTTREDVLWVSPAEPGAIITLQTPRGERRFRGSLIFTADADGSLSVVNAVPTETFLKGVVPAEVYATAPLESLKAQAVAARNEVLSAVGVRHLGDPWLLCNDVHCQMYDGVGRETPRTNQAVEETRGLVMLAPHKSGEDSEHIVDARYSASCGGHTEHNDHVWGGDPIPFLRGHGDAASPLTEAFERNLSDDATAARFIEHPPEDAWCRTDKYGGGKTFRWTRSVDLDTIQGWLDRNHRIGRLRDVQILKRGVSGRVIRMKLVGERGEVVLDRELAIRRAFGGLRSSLFVLDITRDKEGRPRAFEFRGGGFGHGSGMCQTGAMMMAHAGKTHRDILLHYYTGARIETLY